VDTEGEGTDGGRASGPQIGESEDDGLLCIGGPSSVRGEEVYSEILIIEDSEKHRRVEKWKCRLDVVVGMRENLSSKPGSRERGRWNGGASGRSCNSASGTETDYTT